MQSKNSRTQKEETQIAQVLAGYISYWPLFLLCVVLSGAAAFAYVRYTVPQYEAYANIIIKDQKKGVEGSKESEAVDPINESKIIDNEIEVLKSRILVDSIVTRLRLYAPIVQEGKLRIQSAYASCPVLVEARYPDKIKEFKKISLKFDSAHNKIILNNTFSDTLDKWTNTPYGELKFINNPNYVGPMGTKPFFFDLAPVGNVSVGLMGSIKVFSKSKLSSVIDMTCRDEVPEKAIDILNTLIYFYNQKSIEEKISLIRNTLASINSRLEVVTGNMDSIQRKVQAYKAQNKVTDLSAQGGLYLGGVANTDKELSEVNVKMEVLNDLKKYVTNHESVGILPSAVGISDATLTQQMASLNADQLDYQRLKATVGEGNPMLLSLKEKIEKARPNILSNIEAQIRNLQTTRSSLSSTSGGFNSMLSRLPENERDLLEISREQNIQNNIYQFLVQKREEAAISYTAAANSGSRLVNSGQLAAPGPVSPKKSMIYLAALIFGMAFPVALINIREMMNSKVLYRKEIESLTSFPVIGEIVHNKAKNSLVLEPGKRSFIAEEFRKIRVSLLYLGIDAYHKKILVTSSIPGEGKSFVAANLAVSLAMTGKKVALVDIDLHNPSLGKLFNVSGEEPGVSDFLLGEKAAHEIVRRLPAHENLCFIPAGGLHPTPSELLENGEIQKLLTYLETEFDIVIIDTAPLMLVTDAYHLSSIADATLYVVRHKYTPKMLIKRLDENNKINSLKNPAIIFNGVKNRGFLKNNYGYGYDYVYGSNEKITKGKKLKA